MPTNPTVAIPITVSINSVVISFYHRYIFSTLVYNIIANVVIDISDVYIMQHCC